MVGLDRDDLHELGVVGLTVWVCVGSSCHLKGAPEVIERFQTLIASHNLWNRVELKGSFCMNHCTQGVSVKIGDQVYAALGTSDVDRIFTEVILGGLGGDGCASNCDEPR